MLQKLVQSVPLLLLLTVVSMAQDRGELGPSFRERSIQLEPLIIESAKRYGIDPRILRALCFVESRFRVDAVSPKGARGPMQFMPETAARYGLRNPNDPREAIDAAARYLHDLLARFGGRVDLALAGYNAGEGAVESFLTGRPLVLRTGKIINPRGLVTGGIPPYSETQTYVRAIMGSLVVTRATARRASPPPPDQRVVKARDFTLDATGDSDLLAIKKRSAVNSSFIEIP